MATRSALWMLTVKHSLVAIATVFLLWWVISLAVATIFGRSILGSLVLGFNLTFSCLALLLLMTWLYSRRHRGGVLLDCGTDASRRGLLFSAVFYLTFGLSAALGFGIFRDLGVSGINETAIFSSLAIFSTISAFGHLELCEKGIWDNFGLLPWGKIDSYYWEDDTTLIVTIKPGALFFFSRMGGYRVPAKHQATVDHLLRRVLLAEGSALSPISGADS